MNTKLRFGALFFANIYLFFCDVIVNHSKFITYSRKNFSLKIFYLNYVKLLDKNKVNAIIMVWVREICYKKNEKNMKFRIFL